MKTRAYVGLALTALVLVPGMASAQGRTSAQVLTTLRAQRAQIQAILMHTQPRAAAAPSASNKVQLEAEEDELIRLDNQIKQLTLVEKRRHSRAR